MKVAKLNKVFAKALTETAICSYKYTFRFESLKSLKKFSTANIKKVILTPKLGKILEWRFADFESVFSNGKGRIIVIASFFAHSLGSRK